jgi:hypothetical protein
MKIQLVLFLFTLFAPTWIDAQSSQLQFYSDSLRYCKDEIKRSNYNDSFQILLKELLEDDYGFETPLDSIKETISVMESEDKKLKVISWVYINDQEEYFNHCVVMYRKKPNKEHQVYWLQDKMMPKSDSLYEDFSPEFWPGALYYQMIQFKKKRNTYYVVLGYDGKNSFDNRKIIDVLWVDKDNELHIGAPIFYSSEIDYTPKYRILFEYADQTTMFLRYEADKKIITFSNLVPSSPDKMGFKQYYIPDGRIDFYQLKRKGKWVMYMDLENFDFKSIE